MTTETETKPEHSEPDPQVLARNLMTVASQSQKLISDFLTDRKINHPEKEKIMVLINKNEIVAIPGVQISHAYRVKRNSKRVYHLMVKNG